MQIILLERIERLGIIGDVVRVKPGFARNFLLPQGKAMRVTKENLAYFELQKAHIEAENIKNRDEAQKVGAKLEGTVLTVIRQAGQSSQLYGSVSAKDISDTFKTENVDVNRQQVKIDDPIKMLGLHEVRIYLHPEVSIKITINVAQTADEAAAQLKASQEAATAMEREEQEVFAKKKAEKKVRFADEEGEALETEGEAPAPKKKAAKKSEATEETPEDDEPAAPKKKTEKKSEAADESSAEEDEPASKKKASKKKTTEDESEDA
jgi:large subunit ribosomal protein L9